VKGVWHDFDTGLFSGGCWLEGEHQNGRQDFFPLAHSITRKQLQAGCGNKIDERVIAVWYWLKQHGAMICGICLWGHLHSSFFLKRSDGICKLAAATAKIWSMCRSQIKYIYFKQVRLHFSLYCSYCQDLIWSGSFILWQYSMLMRGMMAKPFFPSSYDELIFFLQRNDPTGFPHMRWYWWYQTIQARNKTASLWAYSIHDTSSMYHPEAFLLEHLLWQMLEDRTKRKAEDSIHMNTPKRSNNPTHKTFPSRSSWINTIRSLVLRQSTSEPHNRLLDVSEGACPSPNTRLTWTQEVEWIQTTTG